MIDMFDGNEVGNDEGSVDEKSSWQALVRRPREFRGGACGVSPSRQARCAAALEPIDEGNAAKRGALACETKHLSSEIELSSGQTVKGVIFCLIHCRISTYKFYGGQRKWDCMNWAVFVKHFIVRILLYPGSPLSDTTTFCHQISAHPPNIHYHYYYSKSKKHFYL